MSHDGLRKALVIIAGAVFLFSALFFATSEVSDNTDHLRRICESQNAQNAKQVQLWEFVINLSSSGQPRTPEQDEQTAQFRKFLNETFAQEDCP